MNTAPRRTQFLALLIVLLAFGLSAAVSRAPFERLPHLEDEVAYLWQARLFASGQMVMPSPEPHRSYWQPFIIDADGRRFSKYAPGWPLLLAVGVLVGQPWLINAALTALIAALTFRLGRDLFDPDTGLIAALLSTTSPMALLLSGSLMAHTAATFWGLLMTLAGLRLVHRPRRRWAVLAGISVGMLFITRPLTAAGLGLPFAIAGGWITLRGGWRLVAPPANRAYFARILHSGPLARHIVWSGVRLWWRRQSWKARALLWVILAAAAAGLLTPIYNSAATGSPTANLYTLVWDYDRIGFGPDHGRSGHTPEKALRNMRNDLALWASDLFGWQMAAPLHEWLQETAGWWLGAGLSWLFLLPGLLAGGHRRRAWLLFGQFAGLVGVHLLYWIGAQVYSARYYSEAVPALALVSGAGIVWLARRTRPILVYGVLIALVAVPLFSYTPARLGELWRFNNIGRDHIAALDALRDGRPVLVLVTGEERRSWRDWGAYMVLTDPNLNSDVVAAREHGWPGELEAILARFPARQVLILPPDGPLRPTTEADLFRSQE